jgi:hypothetical protein
MKRRRSVTLFALGVALAGCAESTVVRSYPAGAKVYLNGELKGITPIVLTVPRSQFSDENSRVRLEHEGYDSAEATLRTQVCPGRVVGGVFTLGIVLIFRRPTCFVSPQDFVLTAVPGQTPRVEAAPAHEATVEERLQRIQQLRERGVISSDEYERYRQEILQGM